MDEYEDNPNVEYRREEPIYLQLDDYPLYYDKNQSFWYKH